MTRIDQCLGTLRCRDRRLSVAQSIETPLALIGPAHFSISVSTNFCRYSGELRSRATRSAPISCIRVFTAGGLMVASGAALSLSTIAAGGSLGEEEGNQLEAAELGNPCSCADAWSGSPRERSRVRIAIALTILL